MTLAPTLPRIQRLPDALVNQIAAGEVVERPASALKEIIENSLDAGATRIDVFLRDGGTSEIHVIDNGMGMVEADLRLSVERHATSKLKSLGDLDEMGTYGFRGEALASIASVADVEIRSRTSQMPHALLLRISHAVAHDELTPEAGPPGTSIRIRGLFEKIPARQKFLRSPSTEFSHCAKVVREVALGNPQTQFFLHHQDRLVHSYLAGTRADRFREAAAPSWEPFAFSEQNEIANVEAFLSPPSLVQDRGEVLLFINGRCIRHKTLSAAVRNAYLDHLGPGHEPSGVVYLDIRKDWVDVNVHPQKLEVRLLRQETIYQWLSTALKKRLAQIPKPAVAAPTSHFESGQSPSETPPELLPFQYVGQVEGKYLIVADGQGLLFFEPHELHRVLIWERMKRQPPDPRPLAVPRVLRISSAERQRFSRLEALWPQIGFEVETFGDGELVVKACPAILEASRIERVIFELLRSPDTHTDSLTGVVAAHCAIAPEQALTDAEARSLLQNVTDLNENWTGPHGRRVFFRLRFGSIEKNFESL